MLNGQLIKHTIDIIYYTAHYVNGKRNFKCVFGHISNRIKKEL